MAAINNGIEVKNGALTFGDYSTKEKIKINDHEFCGDLYSLRAHNEVTRLEKNGELLIETVPGAVIMDFKMDERAVEFSSKGFEDSQVTLELEPEKEYRLLIDEVNVGKIKASRSGKLSFSLQLKEGVKTVKLEKN